MKKSITFFVCAMCGSLLTSHRSSTYAETISHQREILDVLEIESKAIKPLGVSGIKPIETLIDALIIVESQGNDSAVGDTHLPSPSIGVLQIRPIMVREVNRILKIQGSEKRFSLKDRWDRDSSIEMFMVWQDFHHSDSNFESIARSWNGGSKGPTNPKTLHYWEKVKEELYN